MNIRNTVVKRIAAVGIAGLMAVMWFTPAWAHGHGGHHGHHQRAEQSQTVCRPEGQCPVCALENCREPGQHYHDGNLYCGYHHDSGYCDGSCLSADCDVQARQGCCH